MFIFEQLAGDVLVVGAGLRALVSVEGAMAFSSHLVDVASLAPPPMALSLDEAEGIVGVAVASTRNVWFHGKERYLWMVTLGSGDVRYIDPSTRLELPEPLGLLPYGADVPQTIPTPTYSMDVTGEYGNPPPRETDCRSRSSTEKTTLSPDKNSDGSIMFVTSEMSIACSEWDVTTSRCQPPYGIGQCLYTLRPFESGGGRPSMWVTSSSRSEALPVLDTLPCAAEPWPLESLDLEVASVYSALWDASDLRLSSDIPEGFNRELRAIVSDKLPRGECDGLSACYYPSTAQLVVDKFIAYDLRVLLHEYGHFVHHSFSRPGMPLSGDDALQESWAQTFALRYPIERLIRGDWASNYYMNVQGISVYRHRERLVNGEWILDPLDNISPLHASDFLYYPNSQCGQAGDGAALCGGVVPATYWELAWNITRTPYGGLQRDEPIVQSGLVPDALGRRLANMAFGYALQLTEAGWNPDTFLTAVAFRYFEFARLRYGGLERSDAERVLWVLGHHCVGPFNFCRSQRRHHLPGSRLASTFTHKQNFIEGEAGRLSMPLELGTGSNYLTSTEVGPGLSSGQALVLYRPRPAVLAPTWGYRFDEPALSSGSRTLQLLAKGGGSGVFELEYRINEGEWESIGGYLTPADFVWWQLPQLVDASDGASVELRSVSGTLIVDAIVLGADPSETACMCSLTGDPNDC